MIPTQNVSNYVVDPSLLKSATFERIKTPAEIKSEIDMNELDKRMAHAKDIGIFLFALGAAITILYICVATFFSPTASVDDKKWVTSIITLVASGTIGYLTGKSSK